MSRKRLSKTSSQHRAHDGALDSRRRDLNPMRQRIAYEAARIMVQEQTGEFEHARRKAAERIGIADKRAWPDNAEIRQWLIEQQRLFGGESHRRERRALLEQALVAMDWFAGFNPRLVGAALDGTASREQGLVILVFADSAEEVIWTLIDRHLPWHADQEEFRYANNRRVLHPVVEFLAGPMPVRIAILPPKARQNPPLDPVTNRPERGASAKDIQTRLADDQWD